MPTHINCKQMPIVVSSGMGVHILNSEEIIKLKEELAKLKEELSEKHARDDFIKKELEILIEDLQSNKDKKKTVFINEDNNMIFDNNVKFPSEEEVREEMKSCPATPKSYCSDSDAEFNDSTKKIVNIFMEPETSEQPDPVPQQNTPQQPSS